MHVLVDTSIWIDHLKKTNLKHKELLEEDKVLIHPFVLGELACGTYANRKEILDLLSLLPNCEEAKFDEVINLIDSKKIYEKGVGFVDVNLLASSLLSECLLWTADKRLSKLALDFGIQF